MHSTKQLVRSLLADLEAWRKKALSVAQALAERGETAEPVAVVGNRRFTTEGWIANILQDIAEDETGDGIVEVIKNLEYILDEKAAREAILNMAQNEIALEVHRAMADTCLERVLNGSSTARDRRNLISLMKALGDGITERAAERLGLDLDDLEAALPILAQQEEQDRKHVTF